MIYKIKEQFWGWGDSFTIVDESDRVRYTVESERYTWGDRLSLKNLGGLKLAAIHQRWGLWHSKYQIQMGSRRAELEQALGWYAPGFRLKLPSREVLTVKGLPHAHEYTFERSGEALAQVSKRGPAWSDHYGIHILDGASEVVILSACIAIDRILHRVQHSGVSIESS